MLFSHIVVNQIITYGASINYMYYLHVDQYCTEARTLGVIYRGLSDPLIIFTDFFLSLSAMYYPMCHHQNSSVLDSCYLRLVR